MRNKTLLGIGVAALLLALSVPAAAQQEASWIHVRVLEDDGAKVSVNLPLALVEVALEIAEKEAWSHHHVQLGRHSDVGIDDLRRMWGELKASGEAQYVDVEDDHERVRVTGLGDRVLIEVEDLDDGHEEVRVELPFSIVDALLAGETDELDIKAAVRELARVGADGDLVSVNDGRTNVRVWIDNDARGES